MIIHNEPSYVSDIEFLMKQNFKDTYRKLEKLRSMLKIIRTTKNPAEFPKNWHYHTYPYTCGEKHYKEVADVHVEGDCVLLYEADFEAGVINCVRIGTHRRLGIGASIETIGLIIV